MYKLLLRFEMKRLAESKRCRLLAYSSTRLSSTHLFVTRAPRTRAPVPPWCNERDINSTYT